MWICFHFLIVEVSLSLEAHMLFFGMTEVDVVLTKLDVPRKER